MKPAGLGALGGVRVTEVNGKVRTLLHPALDLGTLHLTAWFVYSFLS
jgi:hypothetical protein